MTPNETPRTPRRWYSFSLRTFLIVSTLAAIVPSYFLAQWYRGYQTRQAIAALEQEKGVAIARDEKKRVIRIHMAGDKFTDQKMEELLRLMAHLPHLEEIDIVMAPVTDVTLERLRHLPRIKRVYVHQTEVTDDALSEFRSVRPDVDLKTSMPDPVAIGLVARNIYRHAILKVAYSATGKDVLIGTGDGIVRLWDPRDVEPKLTVAAHDDWAFAVAFRPNNSKQGYEFATGGGDNRLLLWQADDEGTLTRRILIGEHDDDIHSLAFSPDGTRLFSASDDHTVRIWDVASREVRRTLEGHTETIPGLAASPDGKLLASASRDDSVRVWDANTGRLLHVLQHGDDVMSVAFSPDSKQLASASYDRLVRVWDVATGQTERRLRGHRDWAFAVAFSPDGRELASGGADGVFLHNLTTGRRWHLAEQTDVSSVTFSPDGQTLATSAAAGNICLWDTRTRSLRDVLWTRYGDRGFRHRPQSARAAGPRKATGGVPGRAPSGGRITRTARSSQS